MSTVAAVSSKVRDRCSQAEWQTRLDLAAAHRLFHLWGMTDTIYTHLSARVPGEPEHFLINPYGLMFHEVSASTLVKIDLDGNIVDEADYGCNPAGYTIHSAIYSARPDVSAAMHLHTTASMAVSTQKDGLLPLNQHALRWYNRIAYHDYEGIALDLDERIRLQNDLGGHNAMILRNHGLLTVGIDVPEAAVLMYYLEQSCQTQVATLAGNRELHLPTPEVCERTARQYVEKYPAAGVLEWKALVRWLEHEDGPGYAA
ncbi:class II aldolase/adducin family protein [Insolitispirillum peregrinum]|uniref:class II aldolase/adducin family protein n=1 Tax=Insolitispirillum peregrinum TaxID=80876 RepID=UPI00362064BD